MSIEIKKLHNRDIDAFVELIRVFEDVFEMQNFTMPAIPHVAGVLARPDFIVFVAIREGKVIAGLTAYTLQQYYAAKPLAYLYDLAVDTRYQRQGIGSKLVVALREYCREQGFEEVFVQADKEDDYAVDFYRTTAPTAEEQVVHFYYTL